MARLILVERRRLLTDREFVEMLSVGQLIPGANMVNMTAMFAYRTGGLRGLLAAMAGFLGPPFLLVVALGLLYQSYGELLLVQKALGGMSAVAVGLIFANAIKLSSALPRSVLPWAFGGMGLLRLPLLLVLGVLGRAIRVGLSPLTIGFVFSSGWVLVQAVNHDWRGWLLNAITIALVLRTRLDPLWLIGAGALAGVAGLV